MFFDIDLVYSLYVAFSATGVSETVISFHFIPLKTCIYIISLLDQHVGNVSVLPLRNHVRTPSWVDEKSITVITTIITITTSRLAHCNAHWSTASQKARQFQDF